MKKWLTVFIDHDYNTLCGVIQYGLFKCWKFRFVFYLQLHHIPPHVYEHFYFTFQFVIKKLIPSSGWLVVSWSKQEVRTVTLVCFFLLLLVMGFAKLSNPPSRYIPPTHPTSSFLEIKNPREYNESLLAIIILSLCYFTNNRGLSDLNTKSTLTITP